MKINNFWGELTDISAKKEALNLTQYTRTVTLAMHNPLNALPFFVCCYVIVNANQRQ